MLVRLPSSVLRPPNGGARRDRTDDLMLAKHALSQLSYGPDRKSEARTRENKFPTSGFRLLTSVV
jgi:hypothetical protein